MFFTKCFEPHFGLKDEELRFFLPAILNNDHQLQSLGPELKPTIESVISYARQFSSFEECLQVIASKSPTLQHDCEEARKAYQNLGLVSSYTSVSAPSPASVNGKELEPYIIDNFRTGRFQRFMVEAVVHGETILAPFLTISHGLVYRTLVCPFDRQSTVS